MKYDDLKAINLGVTLNGMRYLFVKRFIGPYKKYQQELKTVQLKSAAEIKTMQEEKLCRIIHHAYENVPYYHRIFDERGIKPDDIRDIQDLEKLPVIEKEDVRKHYREMVSRTARCAFLYKCHTSGTTGKPLTLYRDLDSVAYEHALLERQWLWAGLRNRERYATLKGELVVLGSRTKPPFWRLDWSENKLIMSSYHLSQKNIEAYIKALKKYKPVGIEGYPSSIFALARFMAKTGASYLLKTILTSSETLTDEHRELIQDVFQCPIFDYYGLAERVVAIHTCEYGSYHIIPEYGITEFAPLESGYNDGEREIIGTALTNYAMPLIRYRVGDVVRPSDKTCQCGRNYPVVDYIVGRKDDYVVTPSGKLIGRLDHIFKGAQNIVEAQIVQNRGNRVVLKVVPDTCFGQDDCADIINKARRRFGYELDVSLEQVVSIPRGRRGKFRAVISEI